MYGTVKHIELNNLCINFKLLAKIFLSWATFYPNKSTERYLTEISAPDSSILLENVNF